MIDCFDHGDNIVHMGKTIAQKGAHVVKDGISMLLLLGIPPKLLFYDCGQLEHQEIDDTGRWFMN